MRTTRFTGGADAFSGSAVSPDGVTRKILLEIDVMSLDEGSGSIWHLVLLEDGMKEGISSVSQVGS